MPEIIYKEINQEIEKKIIAKYGNWVKEFNCLHYGEGCYSIAALCDNDPIGFISTYPLYYPEPLECYYDAYIDDIEVDKAYRRQGIATKLIKLTEEWAKNYGYNQIRAWSSDDKIEAIPMWHALNYCMCPAIMRGESLIKEFIGKPVHGYYVAKMLNSRR
ncbi:GNAT family N-acetyltransferase [Desnuesiella massiliensis]|uniref:GNAT family N-acetyltransferase n=1 Tax=Desnuesiella massiliensis TaxID=1650662 RepID=UPI0006E1D821|nr:GNAT family N-acetyltransferase [Desnuesiella massiliensis]